MKNFSEPYHTLLNNIHRHEITLRLYEKILLLAEKSESINHIYELGFKINQLDKISIINKIEDIEKILLTFGELNENASQEDINNKKKVLTENLQNFIYSIESKFELIKKHFFEMLEEQIYSKLSNMKSTPIGFSLRDVLQEIVAHELTQTTGDDEKKVLELIYKINTINYLLNIKYHFNNSILTDDTIKTYALSKITAIYETDAHVFGQLSIEEIINTEIIYSYTKNN